MISTLRAKSRQSVIVVGDLYQINRHTYRHFRTILIDNLTRKNYHSHIKTVSASIKSIHFDHIRKMSTTISSSSSQHSKMASGESATGNTSKKPNRLIHEKSPYLLQHAYNPVDWYPWGKV